MRTPIPKKMRRTAPKPLAIKLQRLDVIKNYERNARKHSRDQIAQIARSIAAFGFTNPLLVDSNNVLIAGHGRFAAAQLAGLEHVPTICLGYLSDVQVKAYRIADNRLAEVGSSWSSELLQLEVASILEFDSDFDIELTGFDLRELELRADASAADAIEPEEPPEPVPDKGLSRLGDVWEIGPHLLVCGDALSSSSYLALLDRSRAAMTLADIPYNIPIHGHVTGNGKHRHREFVQASGELSDAAFQQFLLTFCLLCARFGRPGALHYLFMDWRHIRHLLMAGEAAFDELINLCVWAKTQGGLGSFYRSQHELIAIFKKGKARHQNNVELGRHGRNRTNLWSYPGMNSFSAERDEALAMHPTVKPVALIRDAMLDASSRGDLILDPFAGSGTTLIAAHEVGRVARLIELDPRYCDVIIARAQRKLGLEAHLRGSDQTFAQVAADRRNESHG